MKLNLNYSRLSHSDFAAKARFICDSMATSGLSTTGPTLSEVSILLPPMDDAMSLTGPTRIPAVQSARAALATGLTSLGKRIMTMPFSDAQLASTGFDVAHVPARTGALPSAPQNIHLKHGVTGEVAVHCDPVRDGGVRSYEVAWTLDPNAGPWQDGEIFASSRKMKITGLPRAKDIWVRVRVMGTNGMSDWGDPATILVI